MIIDKEKQSCLLIDQLCPLDSMAIKKEEEKQRKFEIRRLWSMRTIKVAPVITGVLGIVNKDIHKYLKQIEIEWPCKVLMKLCRLGRPSEAYGTVTTYLCLLVASVASMARNSHCA